MLFSARDEITPDASCIGEVKSLEETVQFDLDRWRRLHSGSSG
jgi:hypothetical protein